METLHSTDGSTALSQSRAQTRSRGGRSAVAHCCACLAVAFLPTACAGQESDPAARGATTPSVTAAAENVPPPIRSLKGRIEYVGPDTFILLDANGRPQPVPGMTYEDFLAAWKRAQNIDESLRQPRFVLEELRIEGKTHEKHASLKIDLSVRLMTDELVAVPLGLSEVILQEQPTFRRHQEPNKTPARDDETSVDSKLDSLEFDPAKESWVAWFKGQSGEQRSLTLNVLVPLHSENNESRLSLAVPRALTNRLMIALGPDATNAVVNSGTITSQTTTPDGKRLEITGAAGPLRLTWNRSDSPRSESSTVFGAAGSIKATVDGRSVRMDARIKIESYGRAVDRVRVRLPPGAKLIQVARATGGPAPTFQVSIEGEDIAKPLAGPLQPPQDRQIVLVQFAEKQSEPVVIDLSTEQPLNQLEENEPVELGGFEVLGAARQFGEVALHAAEDWQVRWEANRYSRQVDPNDLDARIRSPDVTAAFQYDGQPWSLRVRIAPRRLRVFVAPLYEMECAKNEARMRVRLSYQVLGTRAFEFRVDLKGWELSAEPIEAGGSIDRERVSVTPDGILVLPLAQASIRRAEITIAVRRAVPRDADHIAFPLPAPLAESVGTGELLVRGAAGIDLRPDSSQSTGLTPIFAADLSSKAPTNTGVFRFQCVPIEAVFAADCASRARVMSADSLSQLSVTSTEVRIDQRIDYSVRFEPIQELIWEFSEALPFAIAEVDISLLANSPLPEAERDSSAIPLRLLVEAQGSDSQNGRKTRRGRIILPEPRLGEFSIRVLMNWNRMAKEPNGPLTTPQFVPVDGAKVTQRATVATENTIVATLDPRTAETWREANPAAAQGLAEFVATRPEYTLPLVVRAVDHGPSSTVVDRTWIQTWISGVSRQDRVAFRFRTVGEHAVIELPPAIESTDIEILLDGRPVEAVTRSAGRLSVPLKQKSRAESQESRAIPNAPALDSRLLALDSSAHSLELRYRQTVNAPLVTRWRLTPPQMVASMSLSELYWQIILPADRHIIARPELSPCTNWQWLGGFFGRRPTKTQAELEQWAGATSGLSPSAGQSEYLYSGLVPLGTIEMLTAPRWLIVLGASASILVLSIAWIYLPIARRAWLIAVFVCLLGALAVTFPGPAVLLGQASVLGIAAAVVAVWIARWASRAQWQIVVAAGGSTKHYTPPRPDTTPATAMSMPTAGPSSATVLRVGEPE